MDKKEKGSTGSQGGQANQGGTKNPGNFANNREKASEAGRKGGQFTQPTTHTDCNHEFRRPRQGRS